MLQVIAGVLAGMLNIISFVLLLILIIPVAVWTYRTRHAMKNYSDADEWLDLNPKMKEAGAARKSLRRMAIWEFQKYSRKKKFAIISITLAFMITTSWLVWETFPFQVYTRTITNDDARVFWGAKVDQSAQTLTIIGANTPFLDIRRCRVHFIIPFSPTSTGKPNITSSWYLDYKMNGAVTITVEHWIYDQYEYGITNKIVFSKSIEPENDENSISNTTFTNTGYTCYDNFDYHIGVVLSVWLTGFSSVNATLSVTSLNATI